eukprot:s337_g23.t1
MVLLPNVLICALACRFCSLQGCRFGSASAGTQRTLAFTMLALGFGSIPSGVTWKQRIVEKSEKGKAHANYKEPLGVKHCHEDAPCLSRRQKRRRYEDLYWCNVHINAILSGVRRRRRQDKHVDNVLAEYEAIAAREAKDAAHSSGSP